MATSPKDMIKALNQRRAGMDAEYSQWEPHFREVRDAIQPTRGRFSLGEDRRKSTINKKIIDATGRKALRTLRAGLMSGMTSPSRPWFRLGLYDDSAMEVPAVKQYLHVAQTRMYQVLRGSNIYRTLDACYGDIGLYGTFGGLITGDFESVIHSHAFPMGLYRLSENEDGVADTLHYDCRKTVKQVVEQFGLDNVSSRVKTAWNNNRFSDWVDICHAIEPRIDRDPMSPLARDKPWASYYWEKGQTDKFLAVSGFTHAPILGPRWEQVSGETYSVSSPGMDALGDALQLQVQQREKALSIQLMNRPEMMAPAGFSRQRTRGIPGGVTTLDTSDLQKGGMRPTHEVRPDIGALIMDINETRQRIKEAFFEDLFLLTVMSDRREVTAREIAERHEEKLIVLGPVLEALDHGLLQPVIEATFNYMQDAKIMPPAPEEIAQMPVKVEYVSLLAQAQKAVGVATIERTVGFAGSLAQIKPEVLDLIDGDEALREFADQVGPPPKTLRTREDVAAMREQRAQQEQAAAMAQAVEPMANAAKLISEANVRGEEALQMHRRVG